MCLRRRPRPQSSQRKRKPTLSRDERGRTLSERRKAPRRTNQAAQIKDERRVADTAPGAKSGTSEKRQTENQIRERGAVAARARRRKERRIRNAAEQMTKGANQAARTGKTEMQERT